mmetsp:Transcript_36582/g.113860  ORF Transcript_36582/g.113860 Transcript_36582/m.113860 type:complete len:262 (-) Transcript_36582:586-1371(-)
MRVRGASLQPRASTHSACDASKRTLSHEASALRACRAAHRPTVCIQTHPVAPTPASHAARSRQQRTAALARTSWPRESLSVEDSHAVVLVLSAWALDHVALVVDVLGLLAQNEPLEELDEDLVRGEEVDRLAVARDVQDLRDEVCGDLLGLRRQHAEGELPELGRRVVEEEVREDHARREGVRANLARRLRLVVSLDALLELPHQRVRHLRQAALRCAVGDVAWGASTLHPTADGVENVPRHPGLLLHHPHRCVCADQDAA